MKRSSPRWISAKISPPFTPSTPVSSLATALHLRVTASNRTIPLTLMLLSSTRSILPPTTTPASPHATAVPIPRTLPPRLSHRSVAPSHTANPPLLTTCPPPFNARLKLPTTTSFPSNSHIASTPPSSPRPSLETLALSQDMT
eukprot:3904809-Rhodomonas_salina.2